MRVIRAAEDDADRWNEYGDRHRAGCVYHRFEWAGLFHRVYGSTPVYLLAERGTEVAGILPMVQLSSPVFGRIYSSMPFFGHGGMLVDDESIAEALAAEAARLARRSRAKYIELRHLEEHALGWHERRDKVNMLLTLPRTADELFRFQWLEKKKRDKLKSQIKRPEKAGHTVRDGRHELLHPFWLVYSENMRDLGSPCHSERLFGAVLDVFGPRTRVVVVYDGDRPIGGGIVVGGHGTLEIPCASTLRDANQSSPNMMLYARILRYACDEGYERFNFGRSSVPSSTFDFKKQWGAEPHPITYHVWVPPGAPPPNLKPDNPKLKAAVEAWKKLPVPVARLLGPPLVKGIP
jgi:FemAB-related protein (PEP-CTERM system-associated)